MPDLAYVLIAIGLLCAAPFYLFIVSKVWAVGRLAGTREFLRKCNKGDEGGEN